MTISLIPAGTVTCKPLIPAEGAPISWGEYFEKSSVAFQVMPGGMAAVGNGMNGNVIALILETTTGGFLVVLQQNRYFELRAFPYETLAEAQEAVGIYVRPIDLLSEMVQPLSEAIVGKIFDSSTPEGFSEIMSALAAEISCSAKLQGLVYASGCWHPAGM